MNCMQSLKKTLEVLLPVIGDKKVIYLDYPVYSNVGDLLIMKGALQFFSNNGIKILDSFSVYDFDINAIKKKYKLDDCILVFQGGGNYGDLYAPHQSLRRTVFRELPNQKMLMLPQSIHYQDKQIEAQDIDLISKLTNTTFCVRDKMSLSHFKEAGQPVLLVPDMAHELYPIRKNTPNEHKGKLLFLRQDSEINPRQKKIKQASVDWCDLINTRDLWVIRVFRKALSAKKRYYSLLPRWSRKSVFLLWCYFTERLIARSSNFFIAHDEVLTSRLHGYILASLLDMKISFIDNSYKKLSRYTDCWFNTQETNG